MHVWADLRLEPLSAAHAAADHAAVLASASRIRHVFGPDNAWPPDDLSDAQNRADIARHEMEFEERTGFAYSLLARSPQAYAGCFYIKRIKSRQVTDHRKTRFDAQAFLWLTESWRTAERDAVVCRELRGWLKSSWPFRRLAWPGRDVTFADWHRAQSDPGLAERLADRL